MIFITKPFLPPREEYEAYLEGIWQRNWLTNNGPLVKQLESELKEYLDVPNGLYLSNGTIALQLAFKALGLSGELITTPFSYVATVSSLIWEGFQPVFVDIDPDSLNIDPQKIEAAITSKTSAILATHIYGNPCEVEKIQQIADKHSLRVVYDAAHCFGTRYKGKSIFTYGDIATASFHATKLFHTIEGGAVFTQDPAVLKKVALMRNFGHSDVYSFDALGINGKNSEFHAAMGLVNLRHIETIRNTRKKQWRLYQALLDGFDYKGLKLLDEDGYNFSYFPIILPSEQELERCVKVLSENNISSRRYFYPSLNKLPFIDSKAMPISEDISTRVLCLPLYHELLPETQKHIAQVLGNSALT